MKLDEYLSDKENLGDKYQLFLKLKEKLLKEGNSEKIANYKASLQTLTSEKLEEINVVARNKGKNIPAIVFFFKDEKEVELVAKYFPISITCGYEPQINNPELLLAILKLLEKKE